MVKVFDTFCFHEFFLLFAAMSFGKSQFCTFLLNNKSGDVHKLFEILLFSFDFFFEEIINFAVNY